MFPEKNVWGQFNFFIHIVVVVDCKITIFLVHLCIKNTSYLSNSFNTTALLTLHEIIN